MDRIAISVFDSKYFEYAVRMYISLRAFNPKLSLFAGDLGLEEKQRTLLEALDVKVLKSEKAKIVKNRKLSLTFSDFLLHSYLKGINWGKVVWIDADTLILDEISEVFFYDVDVVGHPGRSSSGTLYKLKEALPYYPGADKWLAKTLPCPEDSKYFTTGLWCTRSHHFLEFLDSLLDYIPSDIPGDSPVFTAALHYLGLTCHQLDPSVWNFSRELVCEARFQDGKITYGNDIFPKTIGFSLTEKEIKLPMEDINNFYNKIIRKIAESKPLESLIYYVRDEKYTQAPREKLRMLDKLVTDVVGRNVPGEIVECGVWRGGSALVLGNAVCQTSKKLYLFDTFTGMPAPTEKDYKEGVTYPGSLRGEGGEFGKGSNSDTSVETVRGLFDKMGMDLERVIINKGFLGDSAASSKCFNKLYYYVVRLIGQQLEQKDILTKFPKQICFLHVDVDFYNPYKWILMHLYRRVSHGGIIVFDDYGFWIGAKRAVDEFLQGSGESLQETPGTSQCFVLKTQHQKVYLDLDDFCEEYMAAGNWQLLHELRRIYPNLKVTMFTIPGKSSLQWLRWVRKEYSWIEMALHGTNHEDSSEWLISGEEALQKLLRLYNEDIYTKGLKAPWWKLSEDAYIAVRKAGFWVATNKTNRFAKKEDPLNYKYDDAEEILPDIHYGHAFFDTWHGHVQSLRQYTSNPNGLPDVFDLIIRAWHPQARFGFISEFFK